MEDLLSDVLPNELKKSLGRKTLKIIANGVPHEASTIEEYLTGGSPPAHVLDAVEIFYILIEEDASKKNYAEEINKIFSISGLPYRLCEGKIIVIDSDFLEREVLNRAYELLNKNGFESQNKLLIHL